MACTAVTLRQHSTNIFLVTYGSHQLKTTVIDRKKETSN